MLADDGNGWRMGRGIVSIIFSKAWSSFSGLWIVRTMWSIVDSYVPLKRKSNAKES
jgi:hypothetical protein